jgi:hypothetical protein
MVHPTFIYKTIFKFFKPFLSAKFWRKLHTISKIESIYEYIDKNDLPLPPSVLLHDIYYNKKDLSKNQYFSMDISSLLQRKEESGRKIPKIMDCLITHIEKYGMDQVGLFRVSGTHEELNDLKLLFDYGDNVDLTHCHINLVCDALKLFVRETPEPIIPFDYYEPLLKINISDDDVGGTVDRFCKVMGEMPILNLNLIFAIFNLLYKIQLNSEVNKMNAENLAICFGPNIFRPKKLEISTAIKDNVIITKISKFLILNFVEIFEKKLKLKK